MNLTEGVGEDEGKGRSFHAELSISGMWSVRRQDTGGPPVHIAIPSSFHRIDSADLSSRLYRSLSTPSISYLPYNR